MKSFLVHASLVLGGIVVGLLLLELGVRLTLPHPQRVAFAEVPAGDGAPAQGAPETIELTKRLDEREGVVLSTPTGRRLRPNTHAVIRHHNVCRCTAEIRTNSLGYRNPELGPKERPRVLFLGDSITLADYVPEEQSWVRLVQTLSEATPRPLETVNAGVWAIGLANELAILLETGLATDPDAVVLAWYLNDAQPSPGVRMIRTPHLLARSRLAHHLFQAISVLRSRLVVEEDYGEISHETRRRWRDETAQRFPPGEEPSIDTPEGFNRTIYNLYGDWGSAWSDSAWQHMRPYFVELKRQAQLHGFELFIVAFPVRNQVAAEFVYDHPQRRLAGLADSLDIPLLDLLPRFREAHRSWAAEGRRAESRLFYDWCHHTPRGNRLVAEWVHDFLQEQLGS